MILVQIRRSLLTRSSLFDVVVFTCLFRFAMCFVFTDCPILCFVSVQSTHGLLGRYFGFWLVCSSLAGVFVALFSVLLFFFLVCGTSDFECVSL